MPQTCPVLDALPILCAKSCSVLIFGWRLSKSGPFSINLLARNLVCIPLVVRQAFSRIILLKWKGPLVKAYFALSLPVNETSPQLPCISLQIYQLYHLLVNCLQNENKIFLIGPLEFFAANGLVNHVKPFLSYIICMICTSIVSM